MSTGIQGLAADIFQVALVRLDHELESARTTRAGSSLKCTTRSSSRSPPLSTRVTDLTQGVMKGAVELRVPLEVHLAFRSVVG